MWIFLTSFFVLCNVFNVVLGQFTATPTSPKLSYSMSPLYSFRLALREIDIYKDLKAYNSSGQPLIDAYLEDYENSTLRRGQRAVKDHPFLVFRMIYRFVRYIKPILKNLRNSEDKIEQDLLQKLQEREDVSYPHLMDEVATVAMRIVNLQHNFDLPASELLRGRFASIDTGITLTPKQALEIASYLAQLDFFVQAVDWLAQPELSYSPQAVKTIEKLKKETMKRHDDEFDAKARAGDMYIFAYRFSERPSPPFKHTETKEFLEIGYNSGLQRERNLKTLGLCSKLIPAKVETKFKCFNNRKTHPFFTIAPLKTEILSKSPPIYFYHDAISDQMIKRVQAETVSQLERQTQNLTLEDAMDKMFDRAYLENATENEKVTAPIKSWVEAVTGIKLSPNDTAANNMRSSSFYLYHLGRSIDASQVANDWTDRRYTFKVFNSKLTTSLVYLSDIESGGESVFPDLNLVVKPEKGGVLQWFNYHRNGTVAWKAHQGQCPVILGTKFILSAHAYTYDNMLTYPCGLRPKDY